MRNLLVTFLAFMSFATFAQSKGTISGKIQDKDMGLEPLPFVSIYDSKDNTVGTTSDFDGNYLIKLSPGVHTLVFEFVGYTTIKKQVTVKSGATENLTVVMSSVADALETVVLTAVTEKNTEEAVLQVQKEATVTIDAISAESIKKTGASNVASAVKAVSGVSVQGGKYVYVRGLGDRYTKSLLNGVDIPGLDPDKNTIQMDLFPSSILDNVAVVKTASAEYPADFTGGVVDIITKEIPRGRSQTISVGAGYNPDMHFNKEYLTSEGSTMDFLGFDSGKRSLPIDRFYTSEVGSLFGDEAKVNAMTRKFNPQLAPQQQTSFMDFSLGYALSDLHKIGNNGNKFGYQLGVSYKSSTDFYDNAIDNILQKNPNDTSDNELQTILVSKALLGVQENTLSSMGGLTYKTSLSTYKLNLLHIQNGQSQAGDYAQEKSDAGGNAGSEPIFKDALLYTQKSLTNILIAGSHASDSGEWDLKWKLSPTISRVKDKDHRITTLQENTANGAYFYNATATGLPKRIWRNLDEISLAGKVDITKEYKAFDNAAKLKFGGAYTYKNREFYIDDFLFTADDTFVDDADTDNILASIRSDENPDGAYLDVRDAFNEASEYEGIQTVAAAYVSTELRIFDKLKSIIGLRAELYNTYFTGQNAQGDEVYNNENVISTLDLFPSANLIYEINDKFNVRGSYSKTTARPSFKEASITQILDPITGVRFIGDVEINPTYIDNLDLRFEYYGEDGFFAAISGFYKNFVDPIEITFFEQASSPQLTPKNLGEAKVFGVEVEFRNNFGFIAESLKSLSFNFNGSFLNSNMEMYDAEYNLRVASARDGQSIARTRQLQGQSPYLINSGLNYKNEKNAYDLGVFYNVQGETLELVSFGKIPDVYTKPFHSLNITGSKSFGEEGNSKLKFKVENILGDEKESVYDSYGIADEIYRLRAPGRTFSLGYSYSF